MPGSEIDRLANADRVGVWGFGREGRAVVEWIAEQGWTPTIEVLVDAQHGDEVTAAAEAAGATVHVGTAAAIERVRSGDLDLVIRSPGVPLRSDGMQAVRGAGVPLTTSTTLWFALHQPTNAIVITGTKGKSTTAALLAHLLSADGRDVALLGNIGSPLLAHQQPPQDHDVVVVELSSYQLADLEATIPIGVWLNLFHEHLDWHGTRDAYRREKGRIVELSEVLVANADDGEVAEDATGHPDLHMVSVASDPVRLGERSLPRGSLVEAIEVSPLAGAHHVGNLAAALTAGACVGADPAALVTHVSSFTPLPHRLEVVHDDGRLWVDDSISTIPEAAIAALRAFPDQPITLIAGGFDRDQDHGELIEELAGHEGVRVVTLPPTGERLANGLREHAPDIPVTEAVDLTEAVGAADVQTPEGGVVLLSPAAPSYGAFTSFEERGDQFATLARLTGGSDA